MRSSVISCVVAILLAGGAERALAGIQNTTGDSCQPENNTVVYQRDSGAIINGGSSAKAFVCPIKHINASLNPYGSLYSTQTKLELNVGVWQGTSGNFACTPVSVDIMGGSYTWGITKTFTSAGNGSLHWPRSQLPATAGYPGYNQLTLICSLPPGSRIRGWLTNDL